MTYAISRSVVTGQPAIAPQQGSWQRWQTHLARNHALLAGLVIVTLLLFVALLGRWRYLDIAQEQDLANTLRSPMGFGGGRDYPLGTDVLGRDMLARSTIGLGTSLMIGMVVALAAATIGVTLGILAGLVGGRTDRVLTFAADTQLTLPAIVLGIAVAAVSQPGFQSVLVVLIAASWVGFQRVTRLQSAQLAAAPFVEAALAMGATRWRVMRHHILPNLAGTIAILVTQAIAAAMLFEATLSYVGAGLPKETVSLGGIIADGRSTIFVAWWVSAVPGLFLATAVLGFLLIGDGLARAVDPRGRDAQSWHGSEAVR